MRRQPELLRAALGLALAALLVVPGAASAASKTASAGNVSATLTWTAGEFGESSVKDAKLTITRAGVVAFDKAIPKVIPNGGIIRQDNSDDLRVVDLDGDGEPEVVASGFSGGAHCCTVGGFYGRRGATYGEITEFYGSYGFEVRDVGKDGKLEIESVDARFEDAFSSHAGSWPPPRITRYVRAKGSARLRDVTRHFPSLIRKNAAEAKRRFTLFKPDQGFVDAGGVISGYVADQYLLRRGKVGLAEIDRQARRGVLGTRAQARKFRRDLLRLLDRYGYR